MAELVTWHARDHAFGWALRWTNEGGDPMVTVPEPAFDLLTQVADAARQYVVCEIEGSGWKASKDAHTELLRAVAALNEATS